jgi:hypothetical protein
VGLPKVRHFPHAGTEAAIARREEKQPVMNKPRVTDYRRDDEISYAMPSGVLYGTIIRLIGTAEDAAVQIEFEDGRKEIKKARDRSLSLLRRASGQSEVEERHSDRQRLRDPEIERIRRSEQRKR